MKHCYILDVMNRFSTILLLSAFMLTVSSVSYGQGEQPSFKGIEKIAYQPPGLSYDAVAVCNIQTHDVQSPASQTTAFVMAPSFSQEAELISVPVIERNLSKRAETHSPGGIYVDVTDPPDNS